MEHCCETLCNSLCKEIENYEQAVNNLKKDCCPDQGNLPREIVMSLQQFCKNIKNHNEFISCIKQHSILEKQNSYNAVSFPECKSADNKLRRLVPIHDFVVFHKATPDGSASARKEAQLTIEELKEYPILEWNYDDLNGRTGREDAVSWWTFELEGTAFASEGLNGKDYIRALAIQWSTDTLAFLNQDQTIVELIIDSEVVGNLYKPTALERFEEKTPFRPAKKDLLYGMTCPDPKYNLQGRPELISRSIRYQDKKANITVRYYGY